MTIAEDKIKAQLREQVREKMTAYMSHWANPESTPEGLIKARNEYKDARADYVLYSQFNDLFNKENENVKK